MRPSGIEPLIRTGGFYRPAVPPGTLVPLARGAAFPATPLYPNMSAGVEPATLGFCRPMLYPLELRRVGDPSYVNTTTLKNTSHVWSASCFAIKLRGQERGPGLIRTVILCLCSCSVDVAFDGDTDV